MDTESHQGTETSNTIVLTHNSSIMHEGTHQYENTYRASDAFKLGMKMVSTLKCTPLRGAQGTWFEGRVKSIQSHAFSSKN